MMDRMGFLGKVGSGGTTDSRLFTPLVFGPNADIRLVIDTATDSRGRRVVEGRDVARVDVLR
jgi:hypothetical protein